MQEVHSEENSLSSNHPEEPAAPPASKPDYRALKWCMAITISSLVLAVLGITCLGIWKYKQEAALAALHTAPTSSALAVSPP